MKKIIALIVIVLSIYTNSSIAQVAKQSLIGEWMFNENYRLPLKAEQYPGNKYENLKSNTIVAKTLSAPLIFKNQAPTDRIIDFIASSELALDNFTIETWVKNHVNQPIGLSVSLKSKNNSSKPKWLLGMWDREAHFQINNKDTKEISHSLQKGFKSYWAHIVAIVEKETIKLYVNGEMVSQKSIQLIDYSNIEDYEIEISGYFANEPYMEIKNSLKNLKLYSTALSQQQINQNFEELKVLLVNGWLYRDGFYFNAGPYLHLPTKNSMNLTWETNKPANFVVEYGESLPLSQSVKLDKFNFLSLKSSKQAIDNIKVDELINNYTFDNLKPNTKYFYNIKAISLDNEEMESGVYTFQTAVEDNEPFLFSVISDTEARTHINDRISKMVWLERPNFVINCGDLTDGGFKDHKFEWNYEYFQGVTQLHSRIPVCPVPGNGEGELHWYKAYHNLPNEDEFYSFNYGNSEYFMLNSNRKDEFAKGGKQYVWLEEKLKNSKAKWKFVAFHHAPYSSDEDDYKDSWREVADLGDLKVREITTVFEKYNVDMVFYGHLHIYERTLPLLQGKIDNKNGVIYVTTGGAGGNLENFAPTRSWFTAKTYRNHHYLTLLVNDNRLSFKMYGLDGALIDVLELEK